MSPNCQNPIITVTLKKTQIFHFILARLNQLHGVPKATLLRGSTQAEPLVPVKLKRIVKQVIELPQILPPFARRPRCSLWLTSCVGRHNIVGAVENSPMNQPLLSSNLRASMKIPDHKVNDLPSWFYCV